MNIYYRIDNGEVLYAVYGREAFSFVHTTNTPLDVLNVDEISENRTVCRHLHRIVHHVDVQGRRKYYVQSGELHELDGWVRHIEGLS